MDILRKVAFVIFISLLFIKCKEKKDNVSEPEKSEEKAMLLTNVDSTDFKGTLSGAEVNFYIIRNSNGLEATFTNFGQRLISLYVPDSQGNMADVVLGFSTLEQYRSAKEKYFGATIGRYGNRIAKGKFSIDRESYELATNNNENHLHGGNKGFNSVVWEAEQPDKNELVFTRTSTDMEEGYPGNLEVKVHYVLTEDNELRISYEATTDIPTVVNLTHHSFFNLKGEGQGTVNDHILMINANSYTPVLEGLIPTGEIKNVESTPFDFTAPKPIGQDLKKNNQQLKYGGGYDHNFVLNDAPKNDEGLVLAAIVTEPESGRVMEVFTDEPGLQFYGGNFLDGSAIGKSGKPYEYRGAFCLETQHFPDSPNQPNFPSTVLEPSEKYTSTCIYKFGNL